MDYFDTIMLKSKLIKLNQGLWVSIDIKNFPQMVIRAVTQKSDTPQSPKASWNHQNKDSQRKRNTDMTETTFSTHLVQFLSIPLWEGNWKGHILFFIFLHIRFLWPLPQCRYNYSQQTCSSPSASPEVKAPSHMSQIEICTGWNQGASWRKEFLWENANMNWLFVLTIQTPHARTQARTHAPQCVLGRKFFKLFSSGFIYSAFAVPLSLPSLFGWCTTF